MSFWIISFIGAILLVAFYVILDKSAKNEKEWKYYADKTYFMIVAIICLILSLLFFNGLGTQTYLVEYKGSEFRLTKKKVFFYCDIIDENGNRTRINLPLNKKYCIINNTEIKTRLTPYGYGNIKVPSPLEIKPHEYLFSTFLPTFFFEEPDKTKRVRKDTRGVVLWQIDI